MRVSILFLSIFMLLSLTVHTWALEHSGSQEAFRKDSLANKAAFIESIKAADLALVRKYLDAGADPNAKDGDGTPVLIWAIRTGRSEIVSALLEKGANANARFKEESETPLGFASYGGHLKIVELLLKQRADVNAEGDCKRTALMWAAIGAMQKSAQDFAHQRIFAPVQVEDEDDVEYIEKLGDEHVHIVRLLIAKGADVNVLNDCETGDWTSTALGYAAISGNVTLVRILLENGADPNKGAGSPLAMLTSDEMNKMEEVDESDSAEEKQQKQLMSAWWQSLAPARAEIIQLLREAGAKETAEEEQ